jgi:hypothetical protein
VHLIKQVEQVTISALEGPTWRVAGIPSMGVTDAVEILCVSDLAITALAVIWLQKTARRGRATGWRRGSLAMLPALTGGSTHRATWAAEPLLCKIR